MQHKLELRIVVPFHFNTTVEEGVGMGKLAGLETRPAVAVPSTVPR